MKHEQPIPDAAFPELLAGYADGELSPSDCDRVESWLAANPGESKELQSQRQVAGLFSRPWPSEIMPTDSQWSRVVRNVSVAISTPRPIVAPAARVPRNRLLIALAAIAAAAIAAVFWHSPDSGSGAMSGSPAAEAFAVATTDDVEIMGVFEIDVDRLVVGDPPVRRALVLAAYEDIDGLKVVRDTDGMMPMVAMQAAVVPMIVAPMAAK